MIHLPVLQLEHTQTGLLARGGVILSGRLELLFGLEVVLNGGNLLIEGDVEVVVEVAAVAAHPRKLPKVLLLERQPSSAVGSNM